MNSPEPNNTAPDLAQYLELQEQQIASVRASFAERAFGIGFNALVVPMLILLVIFYLFGVRSWTGLAIILVIEVVAAFILAALFSTRSQLAASRRYYEQTALPAILAYAAENQLSMEQIAAAAANTLPKEALLPMYLKTSGVPK